MATHYVQTMKLSPGWAFSCCVKPEVTCAHPWKCEHPTKAGTLLYYAYSIGKELGLVRLVGKSDSPQQNRSSHSRPGRQVRRRFAQYVRYGVPT